MADNVHLLLRKADEAVAEIRSRYAADLAAKAISDETLYAVRGVVQNIQSALDWTAVSVKDRYYPSSTWQPYFPLVTGPADFPTALEKQLKGLRADHGKIADVFERHQPYHAGKAELRHLHALAKVSKHGDFTPQVRDERRLSPREPAEAIVESGVGRDLSPEPPRGSSDAILFGSPPPRIERLIVVEWLFVKPRVSVLPTLDALARLGREAVEDVRQAAAV